ncbi:amino acid adenylation domain-containing protein [Saccharopolyspora shandongensis]|uniref:amino acid adenylation domain-containing protein n=1 Tax=Saccharopolyspora shandongensis TaxID=418495 RepID=UPI0033C3E965
MQFPLASNQEALWFVDERAGGSRANHVSRAVEIAEPLDVGAFRRCWERLVARHEALRTRFGVQRGVPHQEVLPERALDFEHRDVSGQTVQAVREALHAEADRRFDPTSDPLLRVRVHSLHSRQHWVLVSLHGLVADFRSLALLLAEFGELYRAECEGRPPALPVLTARYADFVADQRSSLEGEAAAAHLEMWADKLTPPPPPLEIPPDHPRPAVQTENGADARLVLPASLSSAVIRFAETHGVTADVFLTTAFQLLLHRHTGQDRIVVGVPATCHDRAEFAPLVGCFVNPVAIDLDLTGDPTFAEVLARGKQAADDALHGRLVPFSRVVERVAPRREASRSPIFQVMHVHLRPPPGTPSGLALLALGDDGAQVEVGGLTLRSLPLIDSGSQFELRLMTAEGPDGLRFCLRYNTDLFDRATAEAMLRNLEELVSDVIAEPARPLSQSPRTTALERRAIAAWNWTARDHDDEPWVHEAFHTRSRERPDDIALRAAGRSVSYRDLARRVHGLAHFLRERGIGPGSIVGVAAERSPELVVALLGTLSAGAAYLPLDPDYPVERIEFMIEDARPSIVLTQSHLRARIPDAVAHVVALDDPPEDLAEREEPVAAAVGDDTPAYVIYTSGSTGRPKGVLVTHAALRNRIAWMQGTFSLTPQDRVLQKTPSSFDVSVWEFFWPMAVGARLVLAEPSGHRDVAYLAEVIRAEGITTIHFVPSVLRLFLAEPGVANCGCLRRMFCSGEALPLDLVEGVLGKLSCELHNLYGPTEATVDVTWWPCRSGDDAVPIGFPVDNTSIHLLDPAGRQVPIGAVGEIHIGGVQVAAGYLNRPALTAERFVPDPFSAAPARLYRTGDLGRRRHDGAVEYLGRLDHQVKIHGNRIEIGEIETRLSAHPAVRDAVVTVGRQAGTPFLEAHVVPIGGAHPEPGELISHLRRRLPAFMIPSRVRLLQQLPLTPSGKADRVALAAAAAGSGSGDGVRRSPRTPAERTLVRIAAEVLAIPEANVDDNFFALGGNSMAALRLRAVLQEAGLDVSVLDVLRSPTFEALARASRPVADQPIRTAPFSLLAAADRENLPDGLEDAYPLAGAQAELLDRDPAGADRKRCAAAFHFGGEFSEPAMREALDALGERHPLLRMSLVTTGFSEPLQFVHRTASVPLRMHDLASVAPESQVDDWSRFQADVRVDRGSFHLVLSHPLIDRWSMGLLIAELMSDYEALRAGERPARRGPLPLGYGDFVRAEREAARSPEEQRFWRGYLADHETRALPRWPSRRDERPTRHLRTEVPVPAAILDGLVRLARAAGTPLRTVLLAAHLKVVGMLGGRTDAMTGVATTGRPEHVGGDQIAAWFRNIVPLRVELTGRSWVDLARRVFDAEQEIVPHRRYPFAEIVRARGGTAPFETAFDYVDFGVHEALGGLADVELLDWQHTADPIGLPLSANFHLDTGTSELTCFLDADDGVLDPNQVKLIAAYYSRALAAMATAPDSTTAVDLRPDEERAVIDVRNATEREWPAAWSAGVHRRVAEHAHRAPTAVAVRCAGLDLSYGELDARAAGLAWQLRSNGVAPGDVVAVSVAHSTDLPAVVLGVHRAGAACLPLDRSALAGQLRHALVDSGASVIVTDQAATELRDCGAAVIDPRNVPEAGAPTALPPPADPDSLAYLIYPPGALHGVEITHRAVDNALHALRERLSWQDEDEVLLAVTTPVTGRAELELFLPLVTGARLDLATGAEADDPTALAELLTSTGATTMHADPRTWRMLVDGGWPGDPGLRIVCGGDVLTADLRARLRGLGRVVWNVCGLAETAIWSTAARVESAAGPSLGSPLANTTCHVVGPDHLPVPVGVPGELLIGGRGLARGYRNRPALTARSFVPAPGAVADRLYRTGNLVRLRPDGELEFLGQRNGRSEN